ncbi:MAG: hypothetical protein ABIA04_09795 [Pseudomonadota bacterium]
MGANISFIYQYGVGGIVFLIGLIIVLLSKELSFKTKKGKYALAILIGGYFLYFFIHALFVFVIPYI